MRKIKLSNLFSFAKDFLARHALHNCVRTLIFDMCLMLSFWHLHNRVYVTAAYLAASMFLLLNTSAMRLQVLDQCLVIKFLDKLFFLLNFILLFDLFFLLFLTSGSSVARFSFIAFLGRFRFGLFYLKLWIILNSSISIIFKLDLLVFKETI